jgi:hypothetical protein
MIAVVSVPTSWAGRVGAQLSHGVALPTRTVEDLDRVYLIAPLATLSGTGLFAYPEVDIQYFPAMTEAVAWAEADILQRRDAQRASVRAAVLEGLRRREERGR